MLGQEGFAAAVHKQQEAGPLDFEKTDAVFEMDQVALLKYRLQWPMKMGTAKLWTVSYERHSRGADLNFEDQTMACVLCE